MVVRHHCSRGGWYTDLIRYQVDVKLGGCAIIAIILLLVLCVGGCAAPADSTAPLRPVNQAMLTAPVVTLHLISINGAEPPPEALDFAVEWMGQYVAGEVMVTEWAHLSYPTDDDGRIDWFTVRSDDVPPSPSDVALAFGPDVAGVNRGVFTLFEDGWQQIIFNVAGIEGTANILLSERRVWEIVLVHELGHVLGVPADSSHIWREGHCTDPTCVIYPTIDWRSVIAGIAHGGPPDDLCEKCRTELARAAAGPR